MLIGTLELALRFPEPQSLKEKRMILKSLVVRLRNRFNVSVAEIVGWIFGRRAALQLQQSGMKPNI